MNLTSPQKIDFQRSGVSRYLQLSILFRSRIDSGAWKIGQQIPTIDELSEEFGVARATIRQAIGLLEREKLISRFRAKGTFVNSVPQKPIWCEMETDWNGLLASRDGATIEILADYHNVSLPPINVPAGHASLAYRYLKRRHVREGQPYLLADVYLDEKLAARLDEKEFERKTALRLAASIPNIKIVDARQTLTVGSADLETSQQLEIPLNAPVCFVDRFAVDQRGRLVLVAKGVYRGDVIRMDIKLR